MSANFQQLANFIWSVADLLRGPYRPPQYERVMLQLTVLRRFDAVLAPSKDAVLKRHAELSSKGIPNIDAILNNLAKDEDGKPLGFHNHSQLDFPKLKGDPDNIGRHLADYIAGFSENIRKIFERFEFDKEIEKLEESNRLYQVVAQFAEIDLHTQMVDNITMGLVFEDLIRRFNEAANETAGDHFTPREVIQLMVNLLLEPDTSVLTQAGVIVTICDPACGTGGMLAEAQNWIRAHNDQATVKVFGQDYNPRSYDRLIAEKERMLALLEEKRAALISRAVTRGLGSDLPMKPSGQEWLGEIPAHWQELRAKGLFREVDRRTEKGEETLLSLRMGKGLVPHNEVSEKLLEASDVTGFKKIAPGQMVINRMRAASGLIAVATEPGLVSPDYAVFDVIDRALSIEYFLEFFKTSLLQAVFRSSSKGLGTGEQGFLRLYTDAFLSLHFPYPPIDEQHAIVAFIKQERSEMLHMESLLLRSIALAKERRAALITAAVTGQIPIEAMRP